MDNNPEHIRLAMTDKNTGWKKWGTYLSERQWGTVREDYSDHGHAWEYFTHDMARYRTYRWGEDGIGGFSDQKQYICTAFAFWNGEDTILKERLFGLTNSEGNHGEDVKELYYYLDATPTHSYTKMLYKYPQSAFPYQELLTVNHQRNRYQPEYEITDTGIFDHNNYFDIFIEHAKKTPESILFKLTVHNRSKEPKYLAIVPTVWFRNIWSWKPMSYKPSMVSSDDRNVLIRHKLVGNYFFCCQEQASQLFCENETNPTHFGNPHVKGQYYKDGIHNCLINKQHNTVNPNSGTKVGFLYEKTIPAQGQLTLNFCLYEGSYDSESFNHFEKDFEKRKQEADLFYKQVQKRVKDKSLRNIQRQAYAGMLWNKQFYHYNIEQWYKGDQQNIPPPNRPKRNIRWKHLSNSNILSMPDKWEYPWYAAWDLAFHCIPLAYLDTAFAKRQLLILLRNHYMHPNGQLPAYEWSFSSVNPPLHAWAAWHVYSIDKKNNDGVGDIDFLTRILLRLSINFTWWANQKDSDENNLFEGGFLGLDNIGVFDRNNPNGILEQADATSWMAMYALNMLTIALEVAKNDRSFEELVVKFLEHFLTIAQANNGLWDAEDNFFYDYYKIHDKGESLKIRSIVGLIPLFATEVINTNFLDMSNDIKRRINNSFRQREYLAKLIKDWYKKGEMGTYILSIVKKVQLEKILERALDEAEFLSSVGIRSLSKYHKEHPFALRQNGHTYKIYYESGESHSSMFGGNSNWRGPVWLPINYLFVEALLKFYNHYGPDYKLEYPTRSGNFLHFKAIAFDIVQKIISIFELADNKPRPSDGSNKWFKDEYFKDYVLFYEYFDGDTGRGLGASHQTGWTGLITVFIDLYYQLKSELEESN